MTFEYAISCGPGTLLDKGFFNIRDSGYLNGPKRTYSEMGFDPWDLDSLIQSCVMSGHTIIIGPAGDE